MGARKGGTKALKVIFYVVVFSIGTVLSAGIFYLMASHFGTEHLLTAFATGMGVVGATHLATRERK